MSPSGVRAPLDLRGSARVLAALWARRMRRLLGRLRTSGQVRRRFLGKLGAVGGNFVFVGWFALQGGTAGPRLRGVDTGRFLDGLVATVFLFAIAGGLSGPPAFPRPGLSAVLTAPLDPRSLVLGRFARQALSGVIGFGLAALLLSAWLLPRGATADHLLPGALGLALLAATLCAVGGAAGACGHRLPRGVADLGAFAGGLGGLLMAGATVVELFARVALAGSSHPAALATLAATDLLLEAARLARPVAGALGATGVGNDHLLAALAAVAAFGLLWVAAPRLPIEGVFVSSERVARAAERGGRRRVRGRGRRLRPFGDGASALVWKALAEERVRTHPVLRVLGWALVLACGIAIPALTAILGVEERLFSKEPDRWIAGAIFPASIGLAVALGLGGRGGAGLGTEILHRSWLLRYPVPPARLLLATIGTPAAQGLLVYAVFVLPSAVAHPSVLGELLPCTASALAVLAAVRIARAAVWLSFPPGPPPDTLSEVLHTFVFLVPLLLAALTGIALGAAGVPVPIAMAAAGFPCAALAGAFWPYCVRRLGKLEA
ncbi:MAG: hypothetical protein L0216_01450 [Planctomycetales bacterium]|nr:hypothetical protein [Planctomycetales bacterium]